MKNFLFFVFLILFLSCKNNSSKTKTDAIEAEKMPESENISLTEISDNENIISEEEKIESPHSDFVNIKSLSSDFILDIKYATEDNFLNQAVYDCPECYLRKATAEALVAANEEFKSLGFRLKLFDCYRPLSVQKKMWTILPGTHYVANPAKGSKHNRGAAVDVTLVDVNGNELDMGTPFDFFGKEAHHTYTNLPEEVLKNRKLLKDILHKHNFKSIYSEWWHYEFRPEMNSKVEDFVWECQ
ncbi:M15 family metallopeptidase [Capnocytophaga felis]|nr:M15 family metallopeptidase [Capnocytophaga felis]